MMRTFATLILSLGLSYQAFAADTLKSFQDPKTKLFGFKNRKGKVVVPAQFQNVHGQEDGEELYRVVKDGTFYRMDSQGKIRFACVFFDNGWDYYEDGLARFLKENKVGYHDKKGNVIIKPKYDFAGPFNEGYALVCNGCWGAYPEPKFQPASSDGSHGLLKEQYMEVQGGKWGAIDTKGTLVVPIDYDDSSAVYDLVHKDKK